MLRTPQTRIGLFALITLLTAGTAIGRVFGLQVEGTQALLTGLATQIVYGGCDAETAEFYSRASGTATSQPTAQDAYPRQRPLLTVDEVITPSAGNCTIFARYVEAGFATQVILNARLTRFYERRDWRERLDRPTAEPLLLERGLDLSPPVTPSQASTLEQAAEQVMARVAREAAQRTGGKTQTSTLSALRQARQQAIEQTR